MFEIRLYYYDSNNSRYGDAIIWNPAVTNFGSGLTEAGLSVDLESDGELTLGVPSSHPMYRDLAGGFFNKEGVVLQTDRNGHSEEIWRGFLSESETDFDGTLSAKFTGVRAYLKHTLYKILKNQQGHYENGYLPEQLFKMVIDAHNESVKSNNNDTTHNHRKLWYKPNCFLYTNEESAEMAKRLVYEDDQEYETSWDVLESEILNRLGGFIKVTREYDGIAGQYFNYIYYVTEKYLLSQNADESQTIRYGGNLLDLGFAVETEDLFTVAEGKAKKKGDSNTEFNITLPSDGQSALIATYGKLYRYFSLDEVQNETEAKALLQKELDKAGLVSKISAKVVDLNHIFSGTEKIRLWHTNNVYAPRNGITQLTKFVCSEIDYDLIRWENTDIGFGRTQRSLTSMQVQSSADNRLTASSVNNVSGRVSTIETAVRNVADSVIEAGVDGDWFFRKWSSGIRECAGNAVIEIPANAFTQTGGLFKYIASKAFPAGLFANTPIMQATAAGGTIDCWCGYSGTNYDNTTARFAIYTPEQHSSVSAVVVTLYAIGV